MFQTGSLKYFAKYYNGDVYYKNENKIIKYNNGQNEEYYTHEQGELKGFNITKNGTFEYF